MHVDANTGLRERKKAATRMAIERAAVEIAHEQGYEAATVEAIAARADVSLRTFFNYFPSKDIAIAGSGLPPIDDEQAHRILEGAGADLLKGIARVAEACVSTMDPTSDLMRRRRGLIRKHASLLPQHLAGHARFEAWLVAVVTDHLRTHAGLRRLTTEFPVEEEARLAVFMVSTAVRFNDHRAIEGEEDGVISARDIEETIDLMGRVHRRGM